MDTNTIEAPAVGANYRNRSTGRTWNISRLCPSGLVGLTESYYGEECDVRVYVTYAELEADFDSVD